MENTFGSYNKFRSLKTVESFLEGKVFSNKVCKFLGFICHDFKQISTIKDERVRVKLALLYRDDSIKKWCKLVDWIYNKYLTLKYITLSYSDLCLLKSHVICFIKSKYKEIYKGYNGKRLDNS